MPLRPEVSLAFCCLFVVVFLGGGGGGGACIWLEIRLIRIKFKNHPLALTCWLSSSISDPESLSGESESWPISLKIAVVTSLKLQSTGMYSNYLLYTCISQPAE